MYLLSEYVDLGTTNCNEWGLPSSVTCGHNGDSETILLRVRYEANTQHWVLDAAYYSMHENYGVYCNNSTTDDVPREDVYDFGPLCPLGSGHDIPLEISYSGNTGGAPISFASMWKHANYATEARCDVGSPQTYLGVTVWHDTCTPAYYHAIDIIGPSRNVGSSGYHSLFLNCTESMDYALQVTSGHYQECYWSGNSWGGFSGWSGVSPMSENNGVRLGQFGF